MWKKKILSRIAQWIPSSINSVLGNALVKIHISIGENYFEYEVFGRKIVFSFYDVKGYYMYRNIIRGEKLLRENIDLTDLKDLGKYDSFLDIGGHYGIYSVIVGVLNRNMNVYYFEPTKHSVKMAEKNFVTNGLDINILKKVVSDTEGRLSFYKKEDGSEGGSLSRMEDAEEVSVESVSISKFIAGRGIDSPFVKIDAEGEEYKIVRDLVSVKRHLENLAVLVELHPDKMEKTVNEFFELIEGHFSEVRPLVVDTERPRYLLKK